MSERQRESATPSRTPRFPRARPAPPPPRRPRSAAWEAAVRFELARLRALSAAARDYDSRSATA